MPASVVVTIATSQVASITSGGGVSSKIQLPASAVARIPASLLANLPASALADLVSAAVSSLPASHVISVAPNVGSAIATVGKVASVSVALRGNASAVISLVSRLLGRQASAAMPLRGDKPIR